MVERADVEQLLDDLDVGRGLLCSGYRDPVVDDDGRHGVDAEPNGVVVIADHLIAEF